MRRGLDSRAVPRTRAPAPRVLYLRRNANHGSATAWNTTKRLTSLSGRVDYPTVAAAGSNVYVAYTDSGAGSVRSRSVGIAPRPGAPCPSGVRVLGRRPRGATGCPGSRRAATRPRLVARQRRWRRPRPSLDRCGRDLEHDRIHRRHLDRHPGRRSLRTRAAVAWTDGSSAVVRTWAGGAWSAPKATVLPPGATYTQTYGPAIALSGTAGVGVAWGGRVTACTSWSCSATRADLVWSELKDGGASCSPAR